jgi:hypothetical protein
MEIKKLLKSELVYLLLLSSFLLSFFIYFAIVSPGCEGGMDSYNHYLISRYSWKYPHLFLDQWGKPLYNILASPFANIGFTGVKLFNIFLWIASAWTTWATIKKLGLQYAWLGFLLVILPQVSIANTISGLTEYLNEFLLILFFYLAASKKWSTAAFVCGLLPFARSEGFVIMAAVGFYLILIEKQYKSLLLFIAGPVIFNGIGWIVEGDPLWIITNNPYIKAQFKALNLCGSGSFFHYFKLSHFIFSLAGSVLVALGTIMALISLLKKTNSQAFINRFMFWLVGGVFWLYFGVHSFIWWKGMMGSCGYSRVMVVITPLMALLGAYAFNNIILNFTKYKNYFMAVLAILLLVSASHSYQYLKRNFPLQISEEQKVFVEVAEWLKTTDYKNGMTYHLYAYLSVLADIDPYDKNHFTDLWSFDFKYSPIGSTIIWDGHFGPNECQIPLEKLKSDPNLVLIKSFIPSKPFTTLNNYPFEVHVFKKVKNTSEK